MIAAGILLAWLFALTAMGCGIIAGVQVLSEKEWGLEVSSWFLAGGVSALLAIFLMLDQLLGKAFSSKDQQDQNQPQDHEQDR